MVHFPLICKDKRSGELFIALGLATNADEKKYNYKNTKVIMMNSLSHLTYTTNEVTLEHFEVIEMLWDGKDGLKRMEELIRVPKDPAA